MKSTILNNLKEEINGNLNNYRFGNFLSFTDSEELIEQQDIIFVEDEKNRSKDDLKNAIRLYNHYKNIPITLASDEKFWAYLTHTSYWEYMINRWPLQSAQGDEVEFIKTRYFFNTKAKTFYRNGLSRLWWISHITYDSSLDDHYYYTKALFSTQDLANVLIETVNLSRNRKALFSVLDNIIELENLEKSGHIKSITNKRALLRGVAAYVNLVGGVTIWDKLSKEEAYEKIKLYINKQVEYLNTVNK